MDDLPNKIEEVPEVANRTLSKWYIPGFIKDAIKWLAEKMCELAGWIWDKIKEVLKGVVAPVYFYKYALDWQDVRGFASGVGGQATQDAMTDTQSWEGDAADAYHKIINPQGKAADKIGTISDKVATALTICAAAGLAFYVAIGVIIVKFIAAMITAIGLLGTAVLSWAGAGLIVEEAGVNTGLIIAAVTTLTALLGAQAQQMVALHGEAVDNGTFPGGNWPAPTAG